MRREETARENPIPRRYNLHEVARILGVSKGTVVRRIREGFLRASRLPGTFRYHVAEDDLRAFIDAAEVISGDTVKNRVTNLPDLEG